MKRHQNKATVTVCVEQFFDWLSVTLDLYKVRASKVFTIKRQKNPIVQSSEHIFFNVTQYMTL